VKKEPTDDFAERRRRKRTSKGDVKPPTTLTSLKKDGCGPLVDLAHQLLRVKIALENAFPGPSVDIQDAFAWDCIKEAAKDPGSPLKPMLDMISEDDVLKSRALAYVSIQLSFGRLLTCKTNYQVWSGASQLRGELARKARENVNFQLQQMRPKDIGDVFHFKFLYWHTY
jgi:hypothetical protein